MLPRYWEHWVKKGDINNMQILDTESNTYVDVNTLSIPNTLPEYKVWKKNQINNSYLTTVKSGFNSSASGTDLIYGYEDQDQLKWMKLFISVGNGIVQYPVKISTKDNTALDLNEVQIKQLLIDINIWEWNNQERLHLKWSDVDACGTIEQASVINY